MHRILLPVTTRPWCLPPVSAFTRARAQVAGAAAYIDDLPRCGILHRGASVSPVAHGAAGHRRHGCVGTAGVHASSPPPTSLQRPLACRRAHDEPIFATARCSSRPGRRPADDVADTVQAARPTRVPSQDIEALEPVLTISRPWRSRVSAAAGDGGVAMRRRWPPPRTGRGAFEVGGQEHFLPGRPDRPTCPANSSNGGSTAARSNPGRGAALAARTGPRQPRASPWNAGAWAAASVARDAGRAHGGSGRPSAAQTRRPVKLRL